MSCCPDFEPLLLERSSHTLPATDAAGLDAHLRGCSGCRREAAALDDLLALVALPPADDSERSAFVGLADSIRAEQVHLDRPRPWLARKSSWWLVGAAAAMLVAAITPLVVRRASVSEPATFATNPVVAAWQEPDPDELLEAADFDDDGSAEVGADELALASATAEDTSTYR